VPIYAVRTLPPESVGALAHKWQQMLKSIINCRVYDIKMNRNDNIANKGRRQVCRGISVFLVSSLGMQISKWLSCVLNTVSTLIVQDNFAYCSLCSTLPVMQHQGKGQLRPTTVPRWVHVQLCNFPLRR